MDSCARQSKTIAVAIKRADATANNKAKKLDAAVAAANNTAEKLYADCRRKLANLL